MAKDTGEKFNLEHHAQDDSLMRPDRASEKLQIKVIAELQHYRESAAFVGLSLV